MRPQMRDSFGSDLFGLDDSCEWEVFEQKNGHIHEGVIRSRQGDWYPIIKGVPCFLTGDLQPDFTAFAEKYGLDYSPPPANSQNQQQITQSRTTETFSDKWNRFKNYGFEESHKKLLGDWFCKKFNLPTIEAVADFYCGKKRILEIGPGSGFNTRFMAENVNGDVFSLDVSDAADTTFENTADLENCHVVKADVLNMPFAQEQFDFVIADGVLHHTPDTRQAVKSCYNMVKPGGQFFFYIYRRMGAIRSFADGYIRETFTKLEPKACYEACEAITELGRELSMLGARITLEKPIPILGIPAGEHDVQRLFYYNVMKCYWNDAFDYETNNMVNFDWYHPHSAWQHTDEEVEVWLNELGVMEFAFNDSNPNGISVMLNKPETEPPT